MSDYLYMMGSIQQIRNNRDFFVFNKVEISNDQMTESLPLLCHWRLFLFFVVRIGIDIQTQALSVKV
jgi:hypothetical protein